MWKEFKEFALKGNVIDMAVGVVIGTAFSGIVNSVVKDIIMPVVGVLTGGIDFTGAALTLREDAVLTYGNFIQNVFNFLIIAFTLFFFVKGINRVKSRFEKKEEEEAAEKPAEPTETELLCEIRDLLVKINLNDREKKLDK